MCIIDSHDLVLIYSSIITCIEIVILCCCPFALPTVFAVHASKYALFRF